MNNIPELITNIDKEIKKLEETDLIKTKEQIEEAKSSKLEKQNLILQKTETVKLNQIQLNTLNEKKEELLSKHTEWNDKILETNKKISKLNEEITPILDSLVQKTSEKDTLETNISEKETLIEQKKVEKQEKETQGENVDTLTQEISQLEQEITELKEQLSTLKDSITQLNNNIQEKTRSKTTLTEENNTNKEELQKVEQSIESNKNEIQTLETSNTNLTVEIDNNTRLITTLTSLINELELEIVKINNKIEELKAEKTRLENIEETNKENVDKFIDYIDNKFKKTIKDTITYFYNILNNSSIIEFVNKQRTDRIMIETIYKNINKVFNLLSVEISCDKHIIESSKLCLLHEINESFIKKNLNKLTNISDFYTKNNYFSIDVLKELLNDELYNKLKKHAIIEDFIKDLDKNPDKFYITSKYTENLINFMLMVENVDLETLDMNSMFGLFLVLTVMFYQTIYVTALIKGIPVNDYFMMTFKSIDSKYDKILTGKELLNSIFED